MTVPRIARFESHEAFVDGAASALAAEAADAIARRGRCRLALAGGSTPARIYQRLAQPDLLARFEWPRLDVFWGDERAVPPDHAASNYRVAHDTWLRHTPLTPGQVHRIEGERAPTDAARRYALVLGMDPLDLIVLGLGEDGHTASLFPGTPELERNDEPVLATRAPVAPFDRVSLSLASINRSRTAHVWISGPQKAEPAAAVWREVERGQPQLPAARIRPAGGPAVWFVDRDAGRLLGAVRTA